MIKISQKIGFVNSGTHSSSNDNRKYACTRMDNVDDGIQHNHPSKRVIVSSQSFSMHMKSSSFIRITSSKKRLSTERMVVGVIIKKLLRKPMQQAQIRQHLFLLNQFDTFIDYFNAQIIPEENETQLQAIKSIHAPSKIQYIHNLIDTSFVCVPIHKLYNNHIDCASTSKDFLVPLGI